MLIVRSRSPGYPQISSVEFEFARNAHRTQRNTFISLLYHKGYDKDTDDQSDEQIHKAKRGRVLNTVAPLSVVRMLELPSIWMYTPI